MGGSTTPNVDFAGALALLKEGKRAARREWVNIKYVYLVPGSSFAVNKAPLSTFLPEGTEVSYESHIDTCTKDNTFAVWLASQKDILALDWFEYNDPVADPLPAAFAAPAEAVTPAAQDASAVAPADPAAQA